MSLVSCQQEHHFLSTDACNAGLAPLHPRKLNASIDGLVDAHACASYFALYSFLLLCVLPSLLMFPLDIFVCVSPCLCLFLSSSLLPAASGDACLVTGAIWILSEHLHPVSYRASRDIRADMRPALKKALRTDLTFEIPENYRRGAVSAVVVMGCCCT